MGLGQDWMGQGSRWGRQGSHGTDVRSSEQPAWRCHRRSQPARVTSTHPSWKQAAVGGSGETSLAELSLTEVHRGRNAGSDPCSLGKGLKALNPGQVSGDGHPVTQALLAPSSAHCPAHLALSVAGLVPLLWTVLGAHRWDIARPSCPGNPCW